jgi:CheY-like chemotaxis protein
MSKPTLLLIDDEERILRSLAMLFRGQYELIATTDPGVALRAVSEQRVHVVVSDQRMPLMRGADLLKQVRARAPQTMRILLTGYSELEAVVASVNEGEIFRFVNKPWDAAELRDTVRQAADISASLFAAGPAAPPEPLQTETGQFVAPASSNSEAILVLDDDAEVYKTVQDIVGSSQPVVWARTLDDALAAFEREAIGIVVSELAPFADVSVFIGLINQGQVYRLLPKPLRRGAFSMSLASALRHHRLLRATPVLRAAHAVEKIRSADESTVAARVMGFLSRIRRVGATP